MSDPVDPIAAVMGILLADGNITARVSDRVFGGELPRTENDDMPRAAVVVAAAGGGLIGHAYQDYGDTRVDVICYGTTLREAWLLHLDVRVVMKALRRQVSEGVLLHWAKESTAGSLARDPVTAWPSAIGAWQVLSAEVAIT